MPIKRPNRYTEDPKRSKKGPKKSKMVMIDLQKALKGLEWFVSWLHIPETGHAA